MKRCRRMAALDQDSLPATEFGGSAIACGAGTGQVGWAVERLLPLGNQKQVSGMGVRAREKWPRGTLPAKVELSPRRGGSNRQWSLGCSAAGSSWPERPLPTGATGAAALVLMGSVIGQGLCYAGRAQGPARTKMKMELAVLAQAWSR